MGHSDGPVMAWSKNTQWAASKPQEFAAAPGTLSNFRGDASAGPSVRSSPFQF